MPSNGSEYVIKITWDAEAGVWIALSEETVGLALESGSLDALMERVRFALPELLELNHLPAADAILFFVERRERLSA